MTTVYWWDEVGQEIEEMEVDVPPGLSCNDTMLLIDAKITQSLAEESFATYDQKCRETDGVWVMDGKFGSDMDTHTYYHPTDPSLALALAEKEIDADEDEDEDEDE